MRQVNTLAERFVLLRQSVDGFESRLIVNARVVEIDHDIVWIVLGIKDVFEGLSRCEKQRSMDLVDLAAVLVDTNVRANVGSMLPGKHQSRNNDTKNNGACQIVHQNSVSSNQNHHQNI